MQNTLNYDHTASVIITRETGKGKNWEMTQIRFKANEIVLYHRESGKTLHKVYKLTSARLAMKNFLLLSTR